MQHSREGVNARYLACSNPSRRCVRVKVGDKVLLTCDVITRLHQPRR